MRKPLKDRTIKNCGGKRGKGGCNTWGGATKGVVKIKIKA